MTPKKILVATDFSTAANAAVQRAAILAHRSGAQLMLLHVMPPKRWLDGLFASRKHWYEQVQSRSNVVLGEQAAKLTAQIGVEIGTALVNGHASAAIRAASEEFEADLVVIGARGERQGQQALDGLMTKYWTVAVALILSSTGLAQDIHRDAALRFHRLMMVNESSATVQLMTGAMAKADPRLVARKASPWSHPMDKGIRENLYPFLVQRWLSQLRKN